MSFNSSSAKKGETEIEDIKEEDENKDDTDSSDYAFAKSSVRDSRPQGERSVKAQPEQKPLKEIKPEPTIQDIEVEEVDDDIPIIDVAEEPQNNS